MVQALAFAEIFLGLILADAGYKGVKLTQIVKGEAGENVAPTPLGATPSTPTGSTPGASLPTAEGPAMALYPAVAAAKALLEAKLHRTVKSAEVGSLYERYHPERSATARNHPPAQTPFESLTGAVEP